MQTQTSNHFKYLRNALLASLTIFDKNSGNPRRTPVRKGIVMRVSTYFYHQMLLFFMKLLFLLGIQALGLDVDAELGFPTKFGGNRNILSISSVSKYMKFLHNFTL